MRFTHLILENYIGIYNGMGLNRIEIDLRSCQHRILIIRGENGSGKSTIFNAMTVLPDSNNVFIPGLPAMKTIELLDGDILYKMIFVHPVKSDGTRDTTKAYLYKTCFGETHNLNPNGNVSSYKDILYDELGLDPNFVALSQLSTEDKGIASKKPAERKRFVNSIMSSLEVYNDIYKTLLKKSSANKALIQSISSRMGALGDPETLQKNLEFIEGQINQVNDRKDQYTKSLMKYNAMKEIVDPDGSIQARHQKLSADIASATKSLFATYSKLNMTILNVELSYEDVKQALLDNGEQIKRKLDDLTSYKKDLVNVKESILEANKQIEQKRQAIRSLTDNESFEKICDNLAISEATLNNCIERIKATGVEPGSFTKSEYIMALETLKDIKEAVLAFRSSSDSTDVMNEVVELAKGNERVSIKDTAQYQAKIDAYVANAPRLNEFILACDRDLARLEALGMRPIDCDIDSCPFISDLIKIRDSNMFEQRAQAARELSELEVCYEDAQLQIAKIKQFNIIANHMNNLLRMVSTNGAILTKLPHGAIYTDKYTFITALMANEDFAYIDEIYKYIGVANIFDEYNAEKAVYEDLAKKRDLYLSKSGVVEQLNSEIGELLESVTRYTAKSENLHNTIILAESQIEELRVIEKELDRKTALLQSGVQFYSVIKDAKEELNSLMKKMTDISHYDEQIGILSGQIKDMANQLAPLYKERDKVMHAIDTIEDYKRDLAVVQESYNLIEKIRYYSSPTSGIQLVFMELYMGKIIGLANELLSLLFGGKFIIQPFIINESEFRIPCQGDGIMNDDISSMSSAQISMISMIIGFALLHNSSTKYNIIKLDEIDGPLDENNRILFIDLLNRIMDIMNTEQCILISHNSEIDVANADLIVLKSDNLSSDYSRGNIIWKY